MNMFTGGRGPVPVQLPHMSTPSQMATFQNTGFHQPQFGGGFPQHLPLRGGMANRMNRNASNAISGMMPGRGISQPDQFSMTPFNPVLSKLPSHIAHLNDDSNALKTQHRHFQQRISIQRFLRREGRCHHSGIIRMERRDQGRTNDLKQYFSAWVEIIWLRELGFNTQNCSLQMSGARLPI